MKQFLKVKISFVFLIMATVLQSQLLAQTPATGINFQAVARDQFSNPAKDRRIFVQSSIVQSTATGLRILIEEHETITDASGVFSISVGLGKRIGGTVSGLSGIDWAKGPYYLNLKIAITPVAPVSGWDYTKDLVDLGTSPFGTVPYALYAGSVFGLDNKLNIADSAKYVTPAQLAAKTFDQTPLLSSIATRLNVADSTKYVTPTQLAAKTFDQTPILNSIATKLNIADSLIKYVTPAQLNAKTFDSTAIYNQLGLKVNTTDVNTALGLKENLSNKSTDLTVDGSSNTKYPSVKSVKDYVDLQVASSIATIVDASPTVKGKIQLSGDLSGTAALPTIANNAVTTSKIADGNITNAKLATGIDATKITGDIAGKASNVTGTVGVLNGGTGATSAAAARTNLGLAIGTDVQAPLSFTAPLVKNANTVSMTQATTSVDGYLSAADFTSFNNKIDATQKAANNGVATLGNDGKIPSIQIPAISFQNVSVINSASAMTSISGAQVGSIAIRTDVSKNFVLSALPSSTLVNWIELATPSSVTSVNGFAGPNVVLTTNDVSEGANNKYYTDARVRSALSAASPLSFNIATGNFSMSAASASNNGYLSASDFTTFNNKQNALTAGTDYLAPNGSAIALTNFPTLNQNTTGNAATATKLAATKNINGIPFDGSASINIDADANTLTGNTLASNITSSSLTSLGTITTGVWSGTTIAIAKGGTGATSATAALTNLGAEPTVNKSNDVSGDGTSTTKFPSVKAVKDYVDLQSANAGVADNSLTSAKINGTISIAKGGTGASTAADARTNLGLGSLATKSIIVDADVDASAAIAFSKLNITKANITGLGVQESLTAGSGISINAGTISATGLTTSNLASSANITNAQLANSALTIGTTNISLGTTTASLAGLSTVTATNFSGALTGNVTGDLTGNLTGNAGTATKLATTKNINGVPFDGSANITIAAEANTLTGTTLASNVLSSSLTSVGTITTGVWSGTEIAIANGGTGATTATGAKTNLGLENVENTALSTWTGSNNITTVGNLSAMAKTFTFQDLVLGYGTTQGKISTDGTKSIQFYPTNNVESTRFWENGNVTIQTGGTFTNNGYKLEVAGATKFIGNSSITGDLDITGNITGATWSGTAIANNKLANSTTTLGSTTMALGGTITSVTGLSSVSSAGFTGALTGNASTATALANGRTISTTGDVTYTSSSFDGTSNVTGSATLTNTTVTAGDYGSSTAIPTFTVDSKGRLTAAGTVGIVAGVNALNYTSTTSYTAGGTISGTSLTLTAANETNPGLISTGAQTIAGAKTFNNDITAPNFIGNLTGNVTGNATTASNAGNITATSNTTITSLSNLNTVGTITSGVWSSTEIAIAKGGTGATSASGALTNLGAEASANKSTATDLGSTSTSDVLFPSQKAVKAYVDNRVASAGVSDGSITNDKLAGSIAASKLIGTDITTVGTITTGVWSGTAIAIANGGTGSTTVVGAKTNLGLNNVENTALSTWTGSNNITTVGNLSAMAKTFTFQDLVLGYGTTQGKISTDGGKPIQFYPTYNVESTRLWGNGNVTIQTGGTFTDNGYKLEVGGTTNFIGNSSITGNLNVTGDITGGTWSGTTIPLTKGGTGATSAAAARTNLGLVIGTDIMSANFTTTLTGDVTGAGNGSFATSLANTNVTAGSYGSSTAIPTFTVDAKGRLTAASTVGIIAGVNTVTAIAGTSNANGATISGTSLTLTPADATNGGLITTGTQTFAGSKTFNSNIIGNLSGNATTATTAGNITATSNSTITSLSALNTVGTITSGTWSASVIGSNVGGAGAVSGLMKANGSGVVSAAVSGTDFEVPLTFTSPLTRTTNTISIPAATSTANGYLTSSDWSTFNNKQTALTAGSGISISGGTISATGLTTSNLSSTAGITVDQLATKTTTLGSTVMTLGGTVTSVTGLTSVSSTGFTGALTGNASTATTLATARNINGTAFNGSADITIIADAGTLSGTTLKSTVTSSSLTGVGTITSGTWNGTTIAVANGGTGVTTSTGSGSVVLSSGPTLVTPILGAATGTSLSITGTLSAGTSSVTSSTVSGNETVGGTLGVTGATTLTSLTASGNSTLTTLTTSGVATLASASITGGATVGGTLGVTAATTLSGTSAHGGAATFSSTVNVTGATTLTTLTASGNSTLTTLTTSGVATLASASITGGATVGGTLGVTGATTLSGTSAHGNAATFSSTVNVTGATSLSSLTASGTSTLTTLTTTSAATFSGTVTIPSGAGLNRVLTSDANGLASWSSNPNTAIISITASTTYTITANDKFVIYSNSTTGTITLPSASVVLAGKEYIIKNISANSIILNTTSSQNIIVDSANITATSVTLGVEASNNWIRVISDGTRWIGFRALF